MLAVLVQVPSSSSSWTDLLFVACVFAMLGAVPLLTDSRPVQRTALIVAVVAALVVNVGLALAFPTAYCDWFFRMLGYCK